MIYLPPVIYLIDRNVLQTITTKRDDNVNAWLATIDKHRLHFSALPIFEWQKGISRIARSKPESAKRGQADLDDFIARWEPQIASIGAQEAKLWGRFLGTKEKNKDDVGIVATAKQHGWTVVSRNIDHCIGYGVRLLNPFKAPPFIINAEPETSV